MDHIKELVQNLPTPALIDIATAWDLSISPDDHRHLIIHEIISYTTMYQLSLQEVINAYIEVESWRAQSNGYDQFVPGFKHDFPESPNSDDENYKSYGQILNDNDELIFDFSSLDEMSELNPELDSTSDSLDTDTHKSLVTKAIEKHKYDIPTDSMVLVNTSDISTDFNKPSTPSNSSTPHKLSTPPIPIPYSPVTPSNDTLDVPLKTRKNPRFLLAGVPEIIPDRRSPAYLLR